MEFIKLNRRKFIPVFFLCILIGCILGGLFSIPRGEYGGAITFGKWSAETFIINVSLASLSFFAIYLLKGLYYFDKTKWLFTHILPLELFDNSDYNTVHIYKKHWILYARECVYGHINGYPTILSVDTPIGKSLTTDIKVYVFIIKFNSTRPEPISFPLKNGGVPENMKQGVTDFIFKLKYKGVEGGSVSNGSEAADMIS